MVTVLNNYPFDRKAGVGPPEKLSYLCFLFHFFAFRFVSGKVEQTQMKASLFVHFSVPL